MTWWLLAAFWLGLGTVVGIIVGSWLAVREGDADDWDAALKAWERDPLLGPQELGPYDHETGLDFDRNERIRRENR